MAHDEPHAVEVPGRNQHRRCIASCEDGVPERVSIKSCRGTAAWRKQVLGDGGGVVRRRGYRGRVGQEILQWVFQVPTWRLRLPKKVEGGFGAFTGAFWAGMSSAVDLRDGL